MKKIIICISSILLIASAYAQSKEKLISKKWLCDKVENAGDEFETYVKQQYDATSNSETKYFLNKYLKFFGNIDEHIAKQTENPAFWVFDDIGTLTAIKIWNSYSEERKHTENLFWKIDNNLLIIYGINTDKREIVIYLNIDVLNANELVLSKLIVDWNVKIHFTLAK
jgi:hypothetical protein